MPRRPPKKWFYEMVERLKKEYPNYPPARIEKIAAGVWYKKYPAGTKAKIVREENPTESLPHHSPIKADAIHLISRRYYKLGFLHGKEKKFDDIHQAVDIFEDRFDPKMALDVEKAGGKYEI